MEPDRSLRGARGRVGVAFACALALVGSAKTASAALLVADFENGVATNALGGFTSTYADGTSTVDPPLGGFATGPGYSSTYSAHMTYTLVSGAPYPYAELVTYLLPGGATTGMDLSAYAGVRFYARGSGNFSCAVATSETAAEYNFYGAYFGVSDTWTRVEIPFSSLTQSFGTPQPWDPKTIYAVTWETAATAGASGELFIDDVEFYLPSEASAPPPPVVLAPPKVDQLGYLPSDPKRFHITSGSSAHPSDAFSILDATTKKTVASGLLGSAVDDTASTGESVLAGDFGSLTTPGRYVVSVNGMESPPFDIGNDVYRPVFRDALRAFYLIRCGVAIDDAETGIQHAACHTADAVLRDDASKSEALTGGWHNAGDFGKWTHEAAISVSDMLWLYELNAEGVSSVDTGTPHSSNGVPDLLDEARWGLSWLLEMQQADGSVFHKVDTEPKFAWGLSPELDPNVRSAGLASTVDAADFAAVMAQASRVFRPFDATFADTCLAASKKAFAWVQANPAIGQTDIYYTDADPSQEVLWALGEMVRATHDTTLSAQLSSQFATHTLEPVSWFTPELFGYMAVALDPSGDGTLASAATAKLSGLCDALVTTAASTGYGIAATSNEYWWESNESLLYRAQALLFGYTLTKNAAYREAALAQLHWFFGDNGLSQSFVTGHGTNPVTAPYHWTYYALHHLMPGWATGGPNGTATGADPLLKAVIAQGTPPAKCYVDQCTAIGSYASNEGETAENGALVFVTGLFLGHEAADAGADAGAPITISASGGCACTAERGANGASSSLFVATVVALGIARRRRRLRAS